MQIPRHWRLREQRYGLTGSVCTQCGKVYFAPRPVCDVCHAVVETNVPRFESRPLRREAHVLEPAQR